jgi:hypothetical protein
MPAMTAGPSESVFNAANITVTRTLVQIGGASYPVNGIGSVMVIRPSRAGWFFAGGFFVLVGLVLIGSVGTYAIILGAALIGIGLLQPHRLMIRTASSNQQALTSRDRNFLHSVKQAIETAVALRG